MDSPFDSAQGEVFVRFARNRTYKIVQTHPAGRFLPVGQSVNQHPNSSDGAVPEQPIGTNLQVVFIQKADGCKPVPKSPVTVGILTNYRLGPVLAS